MPADKETRPMNNPWKPIPARPERYDETWERRRDPIAYTAVKEMDRRGY